MSAPLRGAAVPRRVLALRIAAVVLCSVFLARLAAAPFDALYHGTGADYVAFVSGAHILRSGSTCLYCAQEQAAAQSAVLGYTPPPNPGFPNPYTNPPLAAWLLQPLDAMGLSRGLTVFVLLCTLAVALSMLLLARLAPRAWSEPARALFVVAGVASLPAAMTLVLAQWDPLLLLAAVAAVLAMDRGRPLLAGLLLSVLFVKPQLAWLLPPLLLLTQRWRLAAGVLMGGATWILSGLLIIGPAQMLQWTRYVGGRHAGETGVTIGLPGVASALTGNDGLAFALAPVLAAVALVVAWRLGVHRAARPDTVVAAALLLSPLLAPHVFSDDLILLAVPATLLARQAPRAVLCTLLCISAAYLLDEHVLPHRLAEPAVLLAAVLAVAALSARRRVTSPETPATPPAAASPRRDRASPCPVPR